jgi:hypothetical protein
MAEKTILRRQSVHTALGYLILLSSILIAVEYSLITFHAFSTAENDALKESELLHYWDTFIRERLCNKSGADDCLADWNTYFELSKDSIKVSFFFTQFFLLMATYYTRFFTSKDSSLVGVSMKKEPRFGDENDFVQG